MFNFYGKGPKKDMKIFNNYLSKMHEIVKYHGTIHGNEKYDILYQNDIFILNSRNEGMPMAVLETLSVGLPCFISKETGMGGWIEKFNAGWVNKKKERLFEDLKDCIENYRNNSEYYRSNSLKCAENFYWENIIKIYRSVYKRL